MRGALKLALALCVANLCSSPAQADKVHLVGGSVIEGKVTRTRDKVEVVLETGTLRLEPRDVLRIEQAPTALERLDARRAALPAHAVDERLALANAYRAERLLARERELLTELIGISPDHAEARARLGYVRRAQGGWTQAVPATQPSQQAERDTAALVRARLAREEAELARQRAQLELEKARMEQQAAREARRQAEQASVSQTVWVTPWLPVGCRYGAPCGYVQPSMPPPSSGPAPFPINGVRSPQSYFP